MIASIIQWLQSAPISDEVDRRNAPAMQVFMLFLGLSTPLSWAYQLLMLPTMPAGGLVAVFSAAALTVSCWIGVILIRRGRFRMAVTQLVAILLVTLLFNFINSGLNTMLIGQVDQMLTLIIAALVLGRRALWVSFACLCLISLLGCVADAYRAQAAGVDGSTAFRNLASVVLSYVMVTLILDRTVQALRESLMRTRQRGAQLQAEMIKREQAQSQLIHAQKMETTGRLASGIAHDFGNLLNIILGFARQRDDVIALDSAKERERALFDSLDGVETAANRGLTAISKLLAFSRQDIAHVEVFDVHDAFDDLQPMLRQLFPASVQVHIETSQTPLPVRLDRHEFELMILNMAANARDAMPDGGQFTIRASSESQQWVHLLLRDDGMGMPAQVQARIFEPFFTTKSAGAGTGLGLSITRDLIELAGGTISLQSAAMQGTSFHIQLPWMGRRTTA